MSAVQERTPKRPPAVVVMGVSGCGKSTLAPRLAARLRCRVLEGDSFHSPEAIAKMSAGLALDDGDRWPWLERLGAALGALVRADGAGVAACSALKHAYRERLARAAGEPIAFVYLAASRDALAGRLERRVGHYMPPSLLDSQLETLEPPGAGETALTLDALAPPDALCDRACAWLGLP